MLAGALAGALLAGGCATRQYTVDDGRPVNETLLKDLRAYGQAEQALRPAIVRSAALKDPDCATQWEIPFTVASSEAWSADDRVAWMRALKVDERLTVISAMPGTNLKPGDRIVGLDGYRSDNAQKMSEELVALRDRGRPFSLELSDRRLVIVTPLKVCRGYARVAPPNTPQLQDYHWLMSLHALDLGRLPLTEDEALWVVLWTQGLSEEGALRMKAYHYTTATASTLYSLFSLYSGMGAAAAAANAAIEAARSAATTVASDLIRQQLMDQARSYALSRIQEGLTDAARKLLTSQAVSVMQQAAANRGALGGISRVAVTVFDQADRWAWSRSRQLGANPLAGFTLHQKLLEAGLVDTAFVLDGERLSGLTAQADQDGLGGAVTAALNGLRVADIEQEIAAMPLASAPSAFSYEDPSDTDNPFAHGLIEGALSLPLESKR